MITPLEIKEKRFRLGWRGFNKKGVIDFLDLLSTEFQVILKENRELRQQLDEEKEKKEKLIERESMIKKVLIIAQESSEKIRENAGREAELILKEAELKAENTLREAHEEKNKILRQVEELKASYKQFKAKMQSSLSIYGKFLVEDEEQE